MSPAGSKPIWGIGSRLRAPVRQVAARRDEEAFGIELHRALPRLRRYAQAIVGNGALADDMVQDCLERAWKRRDSLDSEAIPFSWLRTILHNAHVDWHRRNSKDARTVELSDIAETMAMPGSNDGGPVLDLMKALQKLNIDQRRILVLVGIEGLSYQEVADELSVPIGTVMSRLARARAALQALLDPISTEPTPVKSGR